MCVIYRRILWHQTKIVRARSTFSHAVADSFSLGASAISSFPIISSMSLGQLIKALGENKKISKQVHFPAKHEHYDH